MKPPILPRCRRLAGSRLVRRGGRTDARVLLFIARILLTPWGLILAGALDSSLIFFLPLGIDFAVIILAARKPELFWLYAILATIGSVIGAMVTLDRPQGRRHGLTRLMKPGGLERVRHRVSDHAGVSGRAGDHSATLPIHRFVLASGAGPRVDVLHHARGARRVLSPRRAAAPSTDAAS